MANIELTPIPNRPANLDPRVIAAADAITERTRLESVQAGLGTSIQTGIYSELDQRTRRGLAARLTELDSQINVVQQDKRLNEALDNEIQRRDIISQRAQQALTSDKSIYDLRILERGLVNNKQIPVEARQTAISELKQQLLEELQRRQALLKEPSVFFEYRLQKLMEYQQQLLTGDHFVELPTRLDLQYKIIDEWLHGSRVMAVGHTGTGKTELMKHAARVVSGKEPYVLQGDPHLLPGEFVGDWTMQDGSTVYQPADLVKAIIRGEPFIYDDMNVTPNRTNMGLKSLFNLRTGSKINVKKPDGSGVVQETVAEGYYFGGTQNPPTTQYRREETWTEIDKNFSHIDVDYLPADELYDLVVASMLDSTGGLPLSKNDAQNTLRELCDTVAFIQQAYTGQANIEGSGGIINKTQTLEKTVVDAGKIISMLSGWEGASSSESFKTYISRQFLREFINNKNLPPSDRYYLLQIMVLRGFFRGFNVSEFNIEGYPTEILKSDLSAWGFSSADKQTHDHQELYPEEVARLDPYGKVLSLMREVNVHPDHEVVRQGRRRITPISSNDDERVAAILRGGKKNNGSTTSTSGEAIVESHNEALARIKSVKRQIKFMTTPPRTFFVFPGVGIDELEDLRPAIINLLAPLTYNRLRWYERLLINREKQLVNAIQRSPVFSVEEWTEAVKAYNALSSRENTEGNTDEFSFTVIPADRRMTYKFTMSGEAASAINNRFPRLTSGEDVKKIWNVLFSRPIKDDKYSEVQKATILSLYQLLRTTNLPDIKQMAYMYLKDFISSSRNSALVEKWYGASQAASIRRALGL